MDVELLGKLNQCSIALDSGKRHLRPPASITAEVVNWTGKALSAPRARLGQLIRREEAERTGIHVLIGLDPDRTMGLKAYIGEADSVGTRLRHHEADDDKDFFDRVAFVVSKDEN
jgi:hypothetical protein